MIQQINDNLDSMHISTSVSNVSNEEWRVLIDHVKNAQLPILNIGEDRPYTHDDFKETLQNRVEKFEFIEKQLKFNVVLKFDDKIISKNLIAPLVVLCGENIKSTEWTNANLIEISYKILSHLKNKTFKNDSIANIFVNHPDLLKYCLTEVQQKLGKNSWKRYPGAQCSFAYILRQVSSPHMSQYLQEFLPFALRFLDDWEIKNKIFAVECLDHIIEHTDPKELSKFGHTEVLKSVLFHTLSFRDVELISATLPCLYKFLEKCYGSKKSFEDYAKFNTWDELTQKFLYKMQTETQLELKQLYIIQLKVLLKNLNLGVVRWLTTLLQVISSYTELIDVECRRGALENLLLILDLCKDRVKFHTDDIYEPLIRLLYELSQRVEADDESQKTFNLASEALLKSALYSPTEFRLNFDSVEFVAVNETFDRVIHNILLRLKEEEEEKGYK